MATKVVVTVTLVLLGLYGIFAILFIVPTVCYHGWFYMQMAFEAAFSFAHVPRADVLAEFFAGVFVAICFVIVGGITSALIEEGK